MHKIDFIAEVSSNHSRDLSRMKEFIIASKEDETEEILSSSIIKSEGIKNCKIINLASATKSIRSCISSAENSAKVSLKKISIVLEQTEFLCTKFSKHRKIDGSKIQKNDIIMKRPGTGLNGQKINMIIGKKLRKNFSRDHQIRKQDLI